MMLFAFLRRPKCFVSKAYLVQYMCFATWHGHPFGAVGNRCMSSWYIGEECDPGGVMSVSRMLVEFLQADFVFENTRILIRNCK